MKIPFQNHLATCQEVIYSWLAMQLCWTTSTKAIPQLSVALEKICGVHAERGGRKRKLIPGEDSLTVDGTDRGNQNKSLCVRTS